MMDTGQDNTDLSSQLRDIILNTQKPLVIQQFPLDWECFDGSLHDWCERFDVDAASPPEFELMSITDCRSPQWERKRSKVNNLSMQQFLRDYGHLEDEQTHWAAYQYKRANEVPASCLKGIDFAKFGFPDHQNDFTFWLGSEQANTPCHYDTFGINIVVQVYGSKSWLLFPPETGLQSSRIPYEESSVYCLENFYAPSKWQDYMNFSEEAHHCVLQAGEVLIVPRHWWHYVEARETSLSVNYWVPLKADLDLALDEYMVKHIMESFVKNENETMKQYLLNPNQLQEMSDTPSELFEQYERAVENADRGQSERQLWNTDYITPAKLQQMLHQTELNIKTLEVMPKEEYKQLMETNSRRFKDEQVKPTDTRVISSNLEMLINSMCAPRSIASIKREFFRRLRQ